MARPFDFDSSQKLRRLFHYDATEDTFGIETIQDVTEVVEDAKGRFNQFDERTPWKGEMHHVARIPTSVYWDLKRKGVIDDEKAFKRWLNDRDNSAFRVRPGRI